MKITIIIENLLYGGTTTHLINFLDNNISKKHEFNIITNKNNKALKDLHQISKLKNVNLKTYFSFNCFRINTIFLKMIFFSLKPLLFFISIIQMIIILKKDKSDIVLLNCGGYGDFRSELAGAIASKLLGKKKIYLLIHHCYSQPRIWKIVLKMIDKIISNVVDVFFFVSKSTKNSIQINTSLLNKNQKFKIIYNGLKIRKFKKETIKELKTRKDVYKIGMLSRLEDYKGQIELIYSFDNLTLKEKENFLIFFIGNGEKKFVKKLKRLISLKGLNKFFKFIRYINRDSYTILSNLDISISLTKDFEGFGYSIAESLFVKTPVISTNVGGVSEFLSNDIANLIKPNDRLAVTELLKDFLKNKKKWSKKALLGKRVIVSKFNSERMSKEFLKNFNS